jgi:hypothetical protein
MNRMNGLLGLTGIVVAMWSLCAGLAAAQPDMRWETSHNLTRITAAMHGKGLHHRADVLIEIDGREVARGFSRAGCDGLLLIAPLPHTAQGWGHVAPRLDLQRYTVHYAYDGALHHDVPGLQRLRTRLVTQLRPMTVSTRPRLLAVAEVGRCDLVDSAASALLALSAGNDESTSAGRVISGMETS